jgi:HD-like signal output (HDOD) protein
MNDDRIQRVVAGFGALPSLPEIYKELTDEMESEEMSLKRIGDIVARDIALTAKILQLVNSAFFGLPRHVESVGQAISFLGAETIRSLVLSTSVFKSFEAEESEFNPELLWTHSFAVGSVSLALARSESPTKAVADEALQAGMLHDVGQLIIAAGIPEQYREIVEIARSEGKTMQAAEVDVLGCEHAQIGAYLMGLWGLPEGLVEAIAYHHNPEAVTADDFTPHAAVHAANELVHAYTNATDELDDGLLADLGVLESRRDKRSAWLDITKKTLGLADAA